MKALLAIAIMFTSISPACAETSPPSLRPDEAAIVGGWTGPWSAIRAVVLQAVVQEGNCLKLSGSPLLLTDHQTIDTPVMWGAHKLAPGRYAVVGVQWSAPYYDQYGIAGVSPQEDNFWITDIAPGVVTNLGVWPVSSPYPHRYVTGRPDMSQSAGAAVAAHGIAPLVQAGWRQGLVIDADATCPLSAAK